MEKQREEERKKLKEALKKKPSVKKDGSDGE